jgi:hypothetical protein
LQSEDVFIVGSVGSLQESKAFWGKAGGHQWDIRQRALRSLELPKWESSSKMTKVKKTNLARVLKSDFLHLPITVQ